MAKLFVSPEDYNILSKNSNALGVLIAMIDKELVLFGRSGSKMSQIELTSTYQADTGTAYFHDDFWIDKTFCTSIEWIRGV